MIDSTRINAQTIHSINHSMDVRKRDSFEFVWGLIMSLVIPCIQARNKSGLSQSTLKKMELMVPKVEQEEVPNQGELLNRKGSLRRCRFCINECKGKNQKQNKNRLGKSGIQCQKCGEACCEKHSIVICKDCYTT